MKTINTKTQEEYNKVMEIFEEKGYTWFAWNLPTEKNYWEKYKKDTCIDYEDNFWYANINFYKKEWIEIISFQEFLKEEWIINIWEYCILILKEKILFWKN